MPQIIINEADNSILLVLPTYDYRATGKAEELVNEGKADSVLICTVNARVSKKVRIDVEMDRNPEISYAPAIEEEVIEPTPKPIEVPAIAGNDEVPI